MFKMIFLCFSFSHQGYDVHVILVICACTTRRWDFCVASSRHTKCELEITTLLICWISKNMLMDNCHTVKGQENSVVLDSLIFGARQICLPSK